MLLDAPAPATVERRGRAARATAPRTPAIRVVADLRRAGIAADMAFKGNMKKRMAAGPTPAARASR